MTIYMYIYIYIHILHVFLKLIYIDGTIDIHRRNNKTSSNFHIYIYYKHTSLKYLLKWVWGKKAIFSSKLSKRVNTAQVVRKADVGLSALERKVTGQVEEPPGKRGCLGLGFLHAMYTYVYIYIC